MIKYRKKSNYIEVRNVIRALREKIGGKMKRRAFRS